MSEALVPTPFMTSAEVLLDGLGVPALLLDVAGGLRHANPLLGDCLTDTLRQLEEGGLMARLEALRAGQEATDLETEAHLEGQPSVLRWTVRGLYSAQGELEAVLLSAVVQPVQEENFRRFYDALGFGVLVYDAQGVIQHANVSACRLFGATVEVLQGHSPASLAWCFVTEDGSVLPIEQLAVNIALREGMRTARSYALLTDEGERWFMIDAVPLFAGDNLEQVVVSFVDITERRRMLEALRESEERYRSLVMAASIIVWRADGQGNILDQGESWRAFTGQTPEAGAGAGWLSAIHPDDKPHIESLWESDKRSKGITASEYRLWHHSGSYRYVSDRGVPILNAAGEVREWVGAISDIHDKKLAEGREQRAETERALEAQLTLERRHLGRELHDGLRQSLIGMRMLAGSLAKRLAARGADEATLMQEFVALLGDANTQLRVLIGGLVPVSIEAAHFTSALDRAARNTDSYYGIPCLLEAEEGLTLPNDEVALHLYHIAQEAMTNAARHAHAQTIHIRFYREGEALLLEVCDDGRGLDANSSKRGGMGLTNMRYRAEIIDANLEIERLESGTRVRCRLELTA